MRVGGVPKCPLQAPPRAQWGGRDALGMRRGAGLGVGGVQDPNGGAPGCVYGVCVCVWGMGVCMGCVCVGGVQLAPCACKQCVQPGGAARRRTKAAGRLLLRARGHGEDPPAFAPLFHPLCTPFLHPRTLVPDPPHPHPPGRSAAVSARRFAASLSPKPPGGWPPPSLFPLYFLSAGASLHAWESPGVLRCCLLGCWLRCGCGKDGARSSAPGFGDTDPKKPGG